MKTDTKIMWERDGYWDLGYTSQKEKESRQTRFVLNMEPSGNWHLEEILRFKNRRSAMAHAEQRVKSEANQ